MDDSLKGRKDNSQPQLCSCGFFANPAFQNMCSKCFKEKQQQPQNQPSPTTNTVTTDSDTPVIVDALSPAIDSPKADTVSSSAESSHLICPPVSADAKADDITADSEAPAEPSQQSDGSQQPEQPQKPVQRNKARCQICNAKLTLAKQISNKCRCELIFCDKHKSPSDHSCLFDHQEKAKKELGKLNPGLVEKKGGHSFTRI